MDQTRTGLFGRWPTWLPEGGLLPLEAWHGRHRAVLVLLGAHVVAIPVYGVLRDNSIEHSLLEATPVLLALLLACYSPLGRSAQSCVAALGLMFCSGLLVHLSDGLIEAHFHFFVMIPLVVGLYEAWLPFLLGVSYVVIHHGVMGSLDPRSVYNYPAAWERPWFYAGVHAAFFAAACVACIVNWWLHERARKAEAVLVATLAHRAEHDSLTGLPNRAAFLSQRTDLPAGREAEEGSCTSVLMLDLDRFKEVNDTLGHSFGDQLLEQVSERLRAAVRPDDILARLGADEFAVLLLGTDADGARDVAERLLAALRDDFVVDGMLLNVDASVGVTTHRSTGGGDECNLEALLRQADVAMYDAKRTRRGVAPYDRDADDHTRERLTLLAELRRAIDQDELVLYYQPKVSLTDQSLTGLEALIRWEHPERGLLQPAAFIPAAEHTALIVPLTQWVIESALAQTQQWLTQGTAVPVAVNVSPRCLLEPDFPARVLSSVSRIGVPAGYLRLEITESTLLADPDRARAALTTLHEAGVRISIDDFGTGYSSMSYLGNLPIDELKIDRSFVAGMLDRHEDAVLVQSAIDLGHNLGLSVVAEGVETTDTLSALAENGCDIAQGFLYSRPIPAAEIANWLSAEHSPLGPPPGSPDTGSSSASDSVTVTPR